MSLRGFDSLHLLQFNMTPKFSDIVKVIAIVQALGAGQTIEDIAVAMKISPQKVRGWLKWGGYRRLPDGKWVVNY